MKIHEGRDSGGPCVLEKLRRGEKVARMLTFRKVDEPNPSWETGEGEDAQPGGLLVRASPPRTCSFTWFVVCWLTALCSHSFVYCFLNPAV